MRTILDDDEFQKYYNGDSENDGRLYEHVMIDKYLDSVEQQLQDESEEEWNAWQQEIYILKCDVCRKAIYNLMALQEDCMDSFCSLCCDGHCTGCYYDMMILWNYSDAHMSDYYIEKTYLGFKARGIIPKRTDFENSEREYNATTYRDSRSRKWEINYEAKFPELDCQPQIGQKL